MVALKRVHPIQIGCSPDPKQERRGGIETPGRTHRRFSRPSKQERRGGIETNDPVDGVDRPAARSRNAVVALKRTHVLINLILDIEAGTPWWH